MTKGAPDNVQSIAPETDARTTWWPIDLDSVGTGPPIEATVLTRSDGICLFYPARLHALVGEAESCKTWTAYVAALEVIKAGGHVLVVDFEDNERTCVSRLMALGLSRPTIGEQVHFVRPSEPLLDRHGRTTPALRDLTESLESWPIAFAVFDGVAEGMALEGLNPLDNGDVARWYREVPRRATARGAAAVVLDHVTKDRETRGRYAIGGVHKLNGLDGAGYVLAAADPFAPGLTGRIRVTVAKDRPGQVRRHAEGRDRIATLTLISHPDGTVTAELDPPDQAAGPDFEPTVLMEKVSQHLELYPGATKTDLRQLGNASYVDQAIRRLVDLGHVRIERGSRNAHLHHVVTPYRDETEGSEQGGLL